MSIISELTAEYNESNVNDSLYIRDGQVVRLSTADL
jgi:hypothetical protein